jgi:hypothetical protein
MPPPGQAPGTRPAIELWTLREIAEHVADVSYYAEQVGELG